VTSRIGHPKLVHQIAADEIMVARFLGGGRRRDAHRGAGNPGVVSVSKAVASTEGGREEQEWHGSAASASQHEILLPNSRTVPTQKARITT
jgi:hypothetical protein